jgi:hypothetical protein
MTRPSRSTALLALLRAHGIEADGAFDLRSPLTRIEPGMLYSLDGQVYHIPRRSGRGYIAALVPHTPEAHAYLNQSAWTTIPDITYPWPGFMVVRRARKALKIKTL